MSDIRKYGLLVSVLDQLRLEAPKTYKRYHPADNDEEKLNQSRSLAFIHLLLKVRFGVDSFLNRHQLITEESYDGGLDAYYIDYEQKKLFLIQSKFRTNSDNFELKSMSADELLKMDVTKITKGESNDSKGNPFNAKIREFQRVLNDIRDIAKYDYIVLFLGNIYKYSDEQIRRLIDNCKYEIYDSEKSYRDLLFPLTSGTYFTPNEIIIRLELQKKEHPRLKQEIKTDFGEFNITAIFVPTEEIGKMMRKYKNAILQYNPRNYLSLKKASVNESIRNSILHQKNNNFAILNNGITIVSNNINISESTGKQNQGQLILTNPQILNGGQTAYTLANLYDEYFDKEGNPMLGKEVLLKIITPLSEEISFDNKFIESISNATNQQNEVSEADRRSNHQIQIQLQKDIFDTYGYLYEKKQGEFFEGVDKKYIDKSIIIDRLDFIKSYLAYLGEPAAARRTSEKILFKEDQFYKILNKVEKFKEMFFAFMLFNEMIKIEKSFQKKTDSISKYGYSLMYGKWAVISAIGLLKLEIPNVFNELEIVLNNILGDKLNNWFSFDEYVREKHKDTKYFGNGRNNYELYYKINLLDNDIKEYYLK